MWTVREAQDDDFALAVQWQSQFPRFLRYGEEKSDVEFLAELKSGHSFIGVNGKPQAFVSALKIDEGQYSGHLYCDRTVNPDLAVATIMYAKNYLFNNVKASTIVAMVHTRHKTLSNIVLRAGFYSTGLKIWKGVSANGRIFETEQFIVTR